MDQTSKIETLRAEKARIARRLRSAERAHYFNNTTTPQSGGAAKVERLIEAFQSAERALLRAEAQAERGR